MGSGGQLATTFSETLRKEAPVAGRDIVGLMAASPDSIKWQGAIQVRTPVSTVSSRVCISAASIDGLYVARNTYILPPAVKSSWLTLPVPTRFPEVYQGTARHTIALLAQQGDCSQPPGATLLLRVPANDSMDEKVVVSVNSGRTDAYLLVGDDGSDERSRCARIDAPRRTAFDAICEIAVPPSGDVTLRLERCEFGTCRKSPPVNIHTD